MFECDWKMDAAGHGSAAAISLYPACILESGSEMAVSVFLACNGFYHMNDGTYSPYNEAFLNKIMDTTWQQRICSLGGRWLPKVHSLSLVWLMGTIHDDSHILKSWWIENLVNSMSFGLLIKWVQNVLLSQNRWSFNHLIKWLNNIISTRFLDWWGYEDQHELCWLYGLLLIGVEIKIGTFDLC